MFFRDRLRHSSSSPLSRAPSFLALALLLPLALTACPGETPEDSGTPTPEGTPESEPDDGGPAPEGEPEDGGPAPEGEPEDGGPAPEGEPEDGGPAPEGEPEDGGPAPEGEPEDGGTAPTDGGPAPTDSGPAPTDGGPAPTDGGPAPTDGGPAPTDGGPIVDGGDPNTAPTVTLVGARQTAARFAVAVNGFDPEGNVVTLRVVARNDVGAELFDNSFAISPALDGSAFQAILSVPSPPVSIQEVSVSVVDAEGAISNVVVATVNAFAEEAEACIAPAGDTIFVGCASGLRCANPSAFAGVCEAPPGQAPVLTSVVVDAVEIDSPACVAANGKNEVRYQLVGTADLPIQGVNFSHVPGILPPLAASASTTSFDVLVRTCVVSIQEVDELQANATVLDDAARPSNALAFTHPNFVPEPPPQWTCGEETFGGADGCHCGCGELDPDCGSFPTINACEICDAPGGCATSGAGCPADIDSGDIAQCVGPECGDGVVNQPSEQCEPAGEGFCDLNCQVDPAGYCATAELLESGVPATGTTTDAPEVYTHSCTFGGASEEDVVFRYVVTADDVGLEIVLESLNGADHLLAVRTDCADANTELGCADLPQNPDAIEQVTLTGPFSTGDEVEIIVDSFRAGEFTLTLTESAVVVLGEGAACDPDSNLAVCDTTQDLQCLSTAGTFTCEVQEVVGAGEACTPGDTSTVCDAEAGLACDAVDNICVNVLTATCSSAVPLAVGENTFEGVNNDLAVPSSCLDQENAHVFVYTVQTTGNSVAFDMAAGFFGTTALWDTCDQPATETACFDDPTDGFVVAGGPRQAGEQIFVWVASSGSSADIEIRVSEGEAQTLNEGESCTPGDFFATCDAGLICATNGSGTTTCQADPFPNDTCAAPIDITTQPAFIQGTLASANDDFDPEDFGDCTNYSARGPDLVYEVPMTVGQTFDAVYRVINGDASVYLLDTCDVTVAQCVVGADATVNNADEVITFVAPEDRSYFLILDRFTAFGENDEFTLTWSISDPN